MNSPVTTCPLPDHSLLTRDQSIGAYTDCFSCSVPFRCTLEDYVRAFYTTGLFQLERWVLARFLRRASTDEQVAKLASGQLDQFAAWQVEARHEAQLIMCDYRGRTRSWLMVKNGDEHGTTRLYFGSAVVPNNRKQSREETSGLPGRLLTGLHRLYSRALLSAAARQLARDHSSWLPQISVAM